MSPFPSCSRQKSSISLPHCKHADPNLYSLDSPPLCAMHNWRYCPVRVRQMPSAYDAAFSDWALIFSISDDLGSYFNDVAIDKPGAADDWEVSFVLRYLYSLLIENALACACTDTEYYQPHQRFRFTFAVFGDRSTSCPRDRSFDLDSMLHPVSCVRLTWKTVSGVLFPLAAAAIFFSAEARSQFWSTQNATSYLALVS